MLIFNPSHRWWMISGIPFNSSDGFSCVKYPAIMLINPSRSLHNDRYSRFSRRTAGSSCPSTSFELWCTLIRLTSVFNS